MKDLNLRGIVSTCCKSSVSTAGDGSTHWFTCDACRMPCDATGSYTASTTPVKAGKANWIQKLMRRLF